MSKHDIHEDRGTPVEPIDRGIKAIKECQAIIDSAKSDTVLDAADALAAAVGTLHMGLISRTAAILAPTDTAKFTAIYKAYVAYTEARGTKA